MCRKQKIRRWAGSAARWGFLLLAAAGCSGPTAPETAELTGKVTLNGKPLVSGTVSVVCDDGRVDSCSISEGYYRLLRAPVGQVSLAITGCTYEPPPNLDWKNKAIQRAHEAKGNEQEEVQPEDPAKVPSKYINPQTSGLTFEVTPGHPVRDIELP
jgi:hypothetical protein